MAEPRWTIEQASLVLSDTVRISFQRCLCPPLGRYESPPSSLGALPAGVDGLGGFLVPLADDEALWIGLETCGAGAVRVWIAAEMEDLRLWNAVSGNLWETDTHTHLTSPPAFACDGIANQGRSTRAFFRRAPAPDCLGCRTLKLEAEGECDNTGTGLMNHRSQAQVSLVDYATFCESTGQPPPLALKGLTYYRGWRLP